jgi:hypothetical protein
MKKIKKPRGCGAFFMRRRWPLLVLRGPSIPCRPARRRLSLGARRPEKSVEPIRVTDPRLAYVLSELEKREPVFHRPEFGTSRRDFENMTDENFLEVGASGKRYSREFVIDTLVQRHLVPHDDVWEASEFHCIELGPDTYLLSYTLVQERIRVTRRASIWRRTADTWKIVYHQGTVVTA